MVRVSSLSLLSCVCIVVVDCVCRDLVRGWRHRRNAIIREKTRFARMTLQDKRSEKKSGKKGCGPNGQWKQK